MIYFEVLKLISVADRLDCFGFANADDVAANQRQNRNSNQAKFLIILI